MEFIVNTYAISEMLLIRDNFASDLSFRCKKCFF